MFTFSRKDTVYHETQAVGIKLLQSCQAIAQPNSIFHKPCNQEDNTLLIAMLTSFSLLVNAVLNYLTWKL